MGSMDKLVGMIPGMNAAKVPKEMLTKQEGKMKHWKNVLVNIS